jgi:hypothetical protein
VGVEEILIPIFSMNRCLALGGAGLLAGSLPSSPAQPFPLHPAADVADVVRTGRLSGAAATGAR